MPAKSVLLSVRNGPHVRPLLSSITPCEKDSKQQAPDQNKKQAPAFKFWRLRIIFDFSEASYQYLLAETGVR